jgi:anti-sigma28 factor (negative regulator of flagellin synthesis)
MEITIAMEKKPAFISDEIDDLLCSLPDTQEDIIAELRKAVFSGTYEMNSKKIVERILWNGVHILRMSERLNPNSS